MGPIIVKHHCFVYVYVCGCMSVFVHNVCVYLCGFVYTIYKHSYVKCMPLPMCGCVHAYKRVCITVHVCACVCMVIGLLLAQGGDTN